MKQMGALILGLAVLAIVFGTDRPAQPTPAASAPAATTAAAPAPPAAASQRPLGDPIRIARDDSGQFHLTLAVNNVPVRFLVDTGADVVALTEADAASAGITVAPADFQPNLQTASGQGWGAPVRLERIELGHTELRDVDAMVVRDLAVSLLGQSVLRRLGRVALAGDEITLEPGS